MAALQIPGSLVSGKRILPSFDGLRISQPKFGISSSSIGLNPNSRCFRSLIVKASTVVSPKYTTIKPLGDRVLVKVKSTEEKTAGGLLLPPTALTKQNAGEVVSVGEGKSIGSNKIGISVKTGAKVVYSKYAGTEVELDGSTHLILKEDDIVGILETDDVKDLQPLNDLVLIKVAEVEDITPGGLVMTEAAKDREKSNMGTVIAVGPGPLDEEGKRTPLAIAPGSTVLFSKYSGTDLKNADGSNYIAVRAPDVMAVVS